MIDYQNDYKTLYEELRSLVRLYFETVNAEEVEDEDDWADMVMNTELDLCLMVGLIEDEDLDD
jgi:hypothetical protein